MTEYQTVDPGDAQEGDLFTGSITDSEGRTATVTEARLNKCYGVLWAHDALPHIRRGCWRNVTVKREVASPPKALDVLPTLKRGQLFSITAQFGYVPEALQRAFFMHMDPVVPNTVWVAEVRRGEYDLHHAMRVPIFNGDTIELLEDDND